MQNGRNLFRFAFGFFAGAPMFALTLSDFASGFLDKLPTLAAGAVISIASFFIGRWWGRWRASREWRKKEFFNRIIVSLNIFADGYLKIRTVPEESLETVFLNRVAIDKVLKAAKNTTLENPLLPIDKTDRWYILNFVLNEVAEHFATGQLKQDAGVPVTSIRYALFLTCEHVGDERIRKVRALMLKEEHLKVFPYPDTIPKLENPWHEDRIKTLRKAAETYAKEPDQFLMLELCV
jgi:hypothetical protein